MEPRRRGQHNRDVHVAIYTSARNMIGRIRTCALGAGVCTYVLVGSVVAARNPGAAPPPPSRPTPTVLDSDHEFDRGSRLPLAHLSSVQIENAATLGRVWGFLKYYHPAITAGNHHWDYDLLRILPRVLAAPSRGAANVVLIGWIDGLGKVGACAPCAELNTADMQFGPDDAWLRDSSALGRVLSNRLTAIYKRRGVNQSQFYLEIQPQTGQAVFRHELAYSDASFPDPGLQLLALFRLWNMVEYWYPYRNVIGEDWPRVLRDFVPRVAEAADREAYVRVMMQLLATIHDTHANLWSSLDARPPVGTCRLPITVRFVQELPVVSGFLPDAAEVESRLKIGDVISTLDGVPVSALIDRWKPFYGASNETALRRELALAFTRGSCGELMVRVTRDDAQMDVHAQRVAVEKLNEQAERRDDQPGDTVQRLSQAVSYVKLSSVRLEDISTTIEASAGSQGLIVDLRNYPSAFVVFELGSHLVEEPTPFVQFTAPDLGTPGAFHWGPTISLAPKPPYFPGKIAILVDEFTQSQAEYTALALRAAPNAIVIGGTTAGADGNIDPVSLPGRLTTTLTGIGVFYPDRRPTQRVGIVPDLRVERTVDGVRAGRDEVLDVAIQQIESRNPTTKLPP
jgi:C-terminal processing protease CtpA/Prc